jgi:kynurenine 3-monooxygenase
MSILGGARNGIRSVTGRPPSSLGASDIDRNAISESVTAKRMNRRKKTAVIVGGGPGGLAAALVLSNVKKPGNAHDDEETGFFERIIILDEESKASYDPTRSYFFNINRRGQKFTDAFDIDLSKRGTPSTEFAVQYVPSDPKDVFDGSNPSIQLMTDQEKENVGTVYWIPRHELLELISNEIHAKNNDNNNGNAMIEIRRGVRCQYVEPTKDGLVKIVTGNNEAYIVADLCVGADGISSKVRQSLEDGRFIPEKWSNAENPSKNFRLKKYISPSTGLRIKSLRIDPMFTIPKGGTESDSKSEVPIETRYSYVLESTTTGPKDSLRLAIMPQNDPESTLGRPINIITLPGHDIWDPTKIQLDDGGRSAKEYFARVHPRFDWDKIVEEKEWERFASSKGSIFPPCQYSPSMYVSSNHPRHKDDSAFNTEEGFGAGVVLIGDALHSFPPDLGQGVNTAFSDAMMLGKAFEDASESASASNFPKASATKAPTSFVHKALKSYQEKNGPETRALISLARFGAPFQYKQASAIMRFRKVLWTANVVLRVLLNKVTNGFSPKPAIMLMMVCCSVLFRLPVLSPPTVVIVVVCFWPPTNFCEPQRLAHPSSFTHCCIFSFYFLFQDSDMSFRRIMKKANTLTAVLWSILLVVMLPLVRATIKM